MQKGKEKSYRFDTRSEMDEKLKQLFKLRVKTGYKMLYTYPAKNNYHDIYQLAQTKHVS